MTLEPWELSDEQIWGEVDFALVSKWMLSSQRSEENRRRRASQEALMTRDPATQRRFAEVFWRAAQAWADAWAQVQYTWEVQWYGDSTSSYFPPTLTPTDAPRFGALSLGHRPRRQRGPRTAPHFKAALETRPNFQAHHVPAQRQHRRQHR